MKILITILFFLTLMNSSFAQVSVVEAFPKLSFSRPIDLQHAPDGTDRIFVVSQNGAIIVFSTADSTISDSRLFFSLVGDVRRTGNEEGLLGLTFHPDYKNNGYFYVSYNPNEFPRKSIIERYKVTDNPDSADQSSGVIILELQQPAENHNGGQIAFGSDGYLYFGLGDGGGSNDQYGNGQNLTTLLGSMLRINVDDTSSYGNYAIPEDNPFFANDSGYREEIYAWGLRNPWRWSFDPVTGWLWCGDVGQGKWEEIDIIEKGANYGWNTMEGTHCFSPSSGCDDTGLTYPIAEYSHTQGVAVTGGYVYRGNKVPDLYGKYIYGDYGSGLIWTIEYDGVNEPLNEFMMSSGLTISAFGVDKDNELYICDLGGKIYKFYQPGGSNTLTAPELISPANNASGVKGDTVLFSWHGVENADSYMLEGASENTFVADFFNVTTSDTFTTVILNAGDGVDYFWHVKAQNVSDSSDWSSTWKFTTEPATALDSKDIRPAHFMLEQNNPNPFNPATVISYQIAVTTKMTLKVFDITGKEIRTLLDASRNPGRYTVTFDASDLPSGIYFYRLTTSAGFVQSRKMILLK
jgi:glucose/arabinose dehydrogenase